MMMMMMLLVKKEEVKKEVVIETSKQTPSPLIHTSQQGSQANLNRNKQNKIQFSYNDLDDYLKQNHCSHHHLEDNQK